MTVQMFANDLNDTTLLGLLTFKHGRISDFSNDALDGL